MQKVKAFFESPKSNLCGVGLGSALIGLNIFDFSVIGVLAGVFLVVSEGIQYWERT